MIGRDEVDVLRARLLEGEKELRKLLGRDVPAPLGERDFVVLAELAAERAA